jgi:hypothetical protein
VPEVRRAALVLVAILGACGSEGLPFDATASCDIVREPGSMVAAVTGATVDVRARGDVEATTSVRVDLVDADEVVASTSIRIGPLREGERREIEVRFPDMPAGGWPVQPDARCVVATDGRP